MVLAITFALRVSTHCRDGIDWRYMTYTAEVKGGRLRLDVETTLPEGPVTLAVADEAALQADGAVWLDRLTQRLDACQTDAEAAPVRAELDRFWYQAEAGDFGPTWQARAVKEAALVASIDAAIAETGPSIPHETVVAETRARLARLGR